MGVCAIAGVKVTVPAQNRLGAPSGQTSLHERTVTTFTSSPQLKKKLKHKLCSEIWEGPDVADPNDKSYSITKLKLIVALFKAISKIVHWIL